MINQAKSRKLHRLSRVAPKARIDSVGDAKRLRHDRAFDVLWQARQCWVGMEKFRSDRERNKHYAYGDQWSDSVCVDGSPVREADLIRRQGNIPLKNNLIRRMIRNVKGVWRGQETEPTCTARDRDEQKYGETMSTVLQCNMDINRMKELCGHTLEEFLISGMCVHKKSFGWRREVYDCWTDEVQPNNFFIDSTMRDIRGWDVSMLGEIHDIPFSELVQKFARSPEEYSRLARIYADSKDTRAIGLAYEQFGYPLEGCVDFFVPQDRGLCRVIEVWRKETKARWRCYDFNSGEVFKVELEDYDSEVIQVNAERLREGHALGMPDEDIPLIEAEWFVDSYWYYYILTPFGDILDEGETPYEHREHPYVFTAYPFIDGEIHSYVADVIDQQRYVNRLIMLYDFIMKTSAKGVLLFPEDALPDDMSMDDIADEWARADGIIVFKPGKSGQVPRQVASNCTQIGISELLQMQLKLFEDISGVNGAIQGKPGYAGMSASLYNQQTQNATTSLLDLLDTFSAFIREGAYKDVRNIQQSYDDVKARQIAGRTSKMLEYDPSKMSGIQFDIRIVESTATPSYRAYANDFLLRIFEMGQISLEQLLEQGDFPFADSLLQSIRTQKEQIERGETPDALSPELMRQAAAGADQNAVSQAQVLLSAA